MQIKMTEIQKKFISLLYFEKSSMSYSNISKALDVPRETLSIWFDELKSERLRILELKKLWSRKKINQSFKDFYEWYIQKEKKCHYCGITEEKINILLTHEKLKTSRIDKRGKKLELDRKVNTPNREYDINNLEYACYWCNNAKTDSFTEVEFKKVGKVFEKIWEERLSSIKNSFI